jgi:hypothetical protein
LVSRIIAIYFISILTDLSETVGLAWIPSDLKVEQTRQVRLPSKQQVMKKQVSKQGTSFTVGMAQR